jgi:undecaprenyl-diphosphatase
MISSALARRRRITLAWMLALAVLSVALFSTVRYERVLATFLDWPILLKLNHYVFPSDFLNSSINSVANLPILTGALLVGLFWYVWFESNSESAKAELFLGLGAAIAAVILSRGLQLTLPTHLRPLHNPVPGFDVPGMDPAALSGWNSFPSDHACVYFALTTVIWRRSQLLGLFALLPALVGSLPRIFFGQHYPSDIAFGALLGIFIVMMVENYGPETIARRAILFEQKRPGMFYLCGFLLTYEVATLFIDIRNIGIGLAKAYRLFAP